MIQKIQNQSPNLENVLINPRRSFDERRRLPRLSVSTEQFRLELLDKNSHGKVFSVSDLSETGMALRVLDVQDLKFFPVAAELKGTLNLRGKKIPVQAKVRHLTPESIGCEFIDLASEIKQQLSSFLDPAKLGSELKPLPVSEGRMLWYHGPSGTDLLMWRHNDGQYWKFTLYVLGSYIQWEEGPGVSTGVSRASGDLVEQRGILRLETCLLEADDKVDSDKLLIAKKLLLGSNLPQDLKKWCVRHFEST